MSEGGRHAQRPKPLFRFLAWKVAWLSLLVPLWGGGYWVLLADAPRDDPVATGNLIVAGAVVFALVTMLSYAPILILTSFLTNERWRAAETALTEVTQQGWEGPFRRRLQQWYDTVFEEGRYPIPASLALVTFFAGWGFVFFHDGMEFVATFSVDGKLSRLVDVISSGPPISFAFLGSYFFAVWLLFRRYLGGDLGPGAFLHVSVRTWAVTILALVLATILRVSPLEGVGADTTGAVIAGTMFLGALTPSVLLQLITASSLRRLNRTLGATSEEVSLTVLPGMNPWKAARLAEEGIDNVQNLAMEDPSRLIVVTREGGLRILDWIDQALLWTYCSDDVRAALGHRGIRSAFGLYLSFRQANLIDDALPATAGRRYNVDEPPGAMFTGIEPATVRNVLTGIVHTPNFERIRQMREQAMRIAGDMFQTMERREPTGRAPGAGTGVAARPRVTRPIPEEIGAGALLVSAPGERGPRATGVAIAEQLAVTIVDASAGDVVFSGLGDASVPTEVIAGRLLMTDEDTRLALFALDGPVSAVAELAEADPQPGDEVSIVGGMSGALRAAVARIDSGVRVAAGEHHALLGRAYVLSVPVHPGDGGAPVVDQQGRVVAIVVAGDAYSTLAAPVSAVRALRDGAELGAVAGARVGLAGGAVARNTGRRA